MSGMRDKKRKGRLKIGLFNGIAVFLVVAYVCVITIIYPASMRRASIEEQKETMRDFFIHNDSPPYATKVEFVGYGKKEPVFGAGWTFTVKLTIEGKIYNVEMDSAGTIIYNRDDDFAEMCDKVWEPNLQKNGLESYAKIPLEVVYANGEREILGRY